MKTSSIKTPNTRPLCLREISQGIIILLSLIFSLLSAPLAMADKTDVLQQIISRGEIRVGVSMLPPWVLKSPDGSYTGFEVDVANQLARDMGVKVVFKEYQWKAMIPALLKDEIDIIASGLSITPQRALKIAYSQAYSTSGYSLVTNLSLTRGFTSINELNDEKILITAVKGTVSSDLAQKMFPLAKLDLRKTAEDATSAVLNGTVHAFISSSPVPEFIALKHPKKVDTPLNEPLLKTREAFAIRQGNPDMLNFLNAWITAHQADKWIKSTHDYWFDSLKWQRHIKDGELNLSGSQDSDR
jgi:polar amino acid transport system substrate-binding protein